MTWILLTNDDGVDSPALLPFARALAGLGEVRVVVPANERSWVGKAVTRHDPVHARKQTRDGYALWTHTGFPADGVQLGIHALFETPPRLIVSGINIGYNHGAGFLMSSGTVGAAVEGWVSGIPSVAVSTGSLTNWEAWKAHVMSPAATPTWERLASVSVGLIEATAASGLHEIADVTSINLPFEADQDTPTRVTTIARTGYDRLFQPVGSEQDDTGDERRYAHDFGGGIVHFAALDGSDVAAAQDGAISITPLRMPDAVAVPDDIRTRLER